MADRLLPHSSPPVHFTVEELPADVVDKIHEVQTEDPEFLRRVLLYGITHKAVFETLGRAWRI